MAEKQAPQKQSFKKSVKHAAPEIEPRDKGLPQKTIKQKLYTQSGFKKDTPDMGKEKPESEDEKSVLKDIMSISGQGGLFRFISQARNGIIVESLETGKRMQAFATMKVNSLKDIEVFTTKEEVLLEDVFKKIAEKESGGVSIDPKSNPDELKGYFLKILPDYDQQRVYLSDIKKMINWYNILQKHDLLKFEEKTERKAEDTKKSKTEETKKAKAEAKAKEESKAETKTTSKPSASTKKSQDDKSKSKSKSKPKAKPES
jgi:hypothetical protein